jgi:hypothetical protein
VKVSLDIQLAYRQFQSSAARKSFFFVCSLSFLSHSILF